jgi:hypothetical protein
MLVLRQSGRPGALAIVGCMHRRPVTSIRLLLLVLVALVMLSLGVQGAFAQSPNGVQYGNVQGKQQYTPPKMKPAPLNTSKAGGTLPFTGVDLAVVSVAGVLVLAGGFGLRRLGRKSTD